MCCLRSTSVPVLSARRKFVCLTPTLASQRETLCERVSVLSRLLYCQPRMVSRPGKGYIDGSLSPCFPSSSPASQQPSTSSKQRLLKSRLPSSSLVYHHIKPTKSNQTNHHHHHNQSSKCFHSSQASPRSMTSPSPRPATSSGLSSPAPRLQRAVLRLPSAAHKRQLLLVHEAPCARLQPHPRLHLAPRRG